MIRSLSPIQTESSVARRILMGSATGLRAETCVWWLIGLTLVTRLFAADAVGLGYGESYHFSCALRPSLSYFDHPPLAVLLSSASMALTGSMGALAVRGPFLLLFAGTTWLLFVLGRRFFGPWPGFYAALLLNLSAVFTLSTGIFLQSDGPLMFFWLLCTLCLTKIFFDPVVERPYLWWSLVGVTLGLTMLSKYHAVFLLFGAGMVALTRPRQRKWVIHPGPYLAMAIGAVIFAPVLIWNHQHDWISFLWQGNRGLDAKGLRLDWLGRSIGGQALWLLPWIWAPLLWELVQCFRAGRVDKERWFIGWMAVAPIVLFTVVSAYAPIGFHFHWQAPGYLLLFLPLGYTIHRRLTAGDAVTKWWLKGSVAFSVLSLAFVTTHAATGWWNRLGPQWLSAKVGEPDDPTLECLDYTTLESALAQRGLLERTDLFVFTNRWFQSGKVDYALKGRLPVFCFNRTDPRSFAFWDRPEQWIGKDGLLVSTKKFLDDPTAYCGAYFAAIEPLGTVSVPRGGQVAETLYLHYCRDMHAPFPLPYGGVASADRPKRPRNASTVRIEREEENRFVEASRLVVDGRRDASRGN